MDGVSFGDLVTAIGLALVLEGVLFVALPDWSRRMMLSVAQSPAQQLRIAGLISAILGLALIWLIRGS